MTKMYSAVILSVALLFGVVHGRSIGADLLACRNSAMDPSVGHGQTPQSNANAPYAVTVSAASYVPGGSLTVTLTGTQSFRGFLVMALPANDDSGMPIGSFNVNNAGGAALSQDLCSGGMTHTVSYSSNPNSRLTLTWNAPTNANSDVIFYATFVQMFSTYWVKLPSSMVRNAGNSAPTAPPRPAQTPPAPTPPAPTPPASTPPAPTPPAPTRPVPTRPVPTRPAIMQTEPTQPEPMRPEPTQSVPMRSVPIQNGPMQTQSKSTTKPITRVTTRRSRGGCNRRRARYLWWMASNGRISYQEYQDYIRRCRSHFGRERSKGHFD